jgi:hypothetical protein
MDRCCCLVLPCIVAYRRRREPPQRVVDHRSEEYVSGSLDPQIWQQMESFRSVQCSGSRTAYLFPSGECGRHCLHVRPYSLVPGSLPTTFAPRLHLAPFKKRFVVKIGTQNNQSGYTYSCSIHYQHCLLPLRLPAIFEAIQVKRPNHANGKNDGPFALH